MDLNVDYEYGLRIVLSLVVGMAIGFEREYHTKAAGLRTIIMICLGSTIFTEMSLVIDGTSHDRIASTIVTGVGFLGAGVIFKDGITVSGLTTASTIWIAAALGMAIGLGEYYVAMISSIVVMFVLTFLERITLYIEEMHQVRGYKINLAQDESVIAEIEQEMKALKIRFRQVRDMKNEESLLVVYDASSSKKKLDAFNRYLKSHGKIRWYQY